MIRLLCVTALLALSVAPAPAGATGKGFVDPIGASAHGAVWSPEGATLTIDAAFIDKAIDAYTVRALQAATPQQRQRHESLLRYLADLADRGNQARGMPPVERQVALYERTLLLQKLLRELRLPESDRLAARAGQLERWLRAGMATASGQRYDPPAHLQATYAQLGLAAAAAPPAAPPAPPAEVIQARETYAKQCIKKGVPVPPSWGDAAWKSQGALVSPFIITGKTAEVFSYTSMKPAGICLGLPRYTAGAAVATTFGIICMGKSTGTPAVVSACFWDNQLNEAEIDIPRVPAKPVPLTVGWEAGSRMGDVGGKCSSCHAGENPFVVHPEENAFIALGNAIKPDAYYKPHIRGDWPQNDGANTLLGGAVPGGESRCTSCHSEGSRRRLPEIVEGLAKPPGSNYCEQVLKIAINRRTMPDVGVGADAAYATHSKILLDACEKAAK